MADNLLDNYNPLYDIHLRQYFALPHMQKHLQKMGLLESTLNLNGDEVYARHHAMMDMMLKNREAQLVKMAELRKKLDAAEKVEICRRIRTGQSPESYRRGKPSRSLSRNRANEKGGRGGRQRRFSNSYEDRDFVQNIEEKNADPEDYDTRDPYKRLSANAKRFNYLHKLDDKTLIAYKDNLKQQLQRLERFREISFGPHSVARQPPPPQASWFFRRRSVLNMRGRKTTTGNKLNASHDNRTSCPPTTRKRKDSNSRLPPINPKGRVSTKPPAPLAFQQTTTKLPPAAKKPAPTRGRPSDKRQTTTTTTTTITSVSRSPTNPTALPVLPAVTGHGIFTGAAAAATVAAIGTAAIDVKSLISDEHQKTPTPPASPVLEEQNASERSSSADHLPANDPFEAPEQLHDGPKYNDDDDAEHIAREVILDKAPISDNHGDYEDSDSEPEYAEEDRESSPEQSFKHPEVQITQTAETPLIFENRQSSPSISSLDNTQQNEQTTEQFDREDHIEEKISLDLKSEEETSEKDNIKSPSIISEENDVSSGISAQGVTEESESVPFNEELETKEDASEDSNTDVPEHFEALHHASLQGIEHPLPSAGIPHLLDDHEDDHQKSEVVEESPHATEHLEQHEAVPQSPVTSIHSVEAQQENAPTSPVLSIHGSEVQQEDAPTSPVLSIHSDKVQEENAPTSPVLSIHGEKVQQEDAPTSPVLSVHTSENDTEERNQIGHEEDDVPQLSSVDQYPDVPAATTDFSEQLKDSLEKSVTPPHSDDIEGSLPSPVIQQHDVAALHDSSEDVDHESHEAAISTNPVLTVNDDEELNLTADGTDATHNHFAEPKSLTTSIDSTNEMDHDDHAVSPPENAFLPRSPSVHTSDASDHENELAFEKNEQHTLVQNNDDHNELNFVNHEVTTESELYNPSNGNMESPQFSDDEHGDVRESEVSASPTAQIAAEEENGDLSQEQRMAIADRINMEAYHNSPTKESTSPIAANILPAHITAEEVANQLNNSDRPVENVEDIVNQSADEDASSVISEKSNEAPVVFNAHQERSSPIDNPIHPPEAYELNYNDNERQEVDAMTTSVYNPSSENEGSQTSLNVEPETTTKIKEWDNEDEHVKETVTRSEFTDGNTHQTYSETVTVITEKTNDVKSFPDAESAVSPNTNSADNISTDSLIIHDNNDQADYEMSQSIYEPKEEIEEKEWDDGNKHVHEVVSNVEHTDETGKHFTETVTTTTTVIETNDNAKNNNDDANEKEQHGEEDHKSIVEEHMHGSNGNYMDSSSTSHIATSVGLPEGGILVDDEDETNTSSL